MNDSGVGGSTSAIGAVARWCKGRATLARVFTNSAWLLADNLFRMGMAFFVGAWVARHLGPERFGLLNFAIAFCAPLGAMVGLGLNGIVVRDLVREPTAAGELLGSTAALKAGTAVLALGFCFVVMVLTPGLETETRLMVAIALIGTVLQPVDIFETWFQSQTQARVVACTRSVASLVANGARVAMILFDAPLVWFAGSAGVELAVCGIGWAIVYRRSGRFASWRISFPRCLGLLRECWMVALAGVAVQFQAHIDQIMLAALRSPAEVGEYAAALRLVALFGFIPVVVCAAASPEITRARADDPLRYLHRLTQLYRAMLAIFILAWAFLVVLAGPAVLLVFGGNYAAAIGLVPLLGWRLLLTNLGVVRGLFLTNEKMLFHALITAVVGAVINVALNLMLIPHWGSAGCIVASLVSFSLSTVALEWIGPRGRLNLRLMAAAATFRTVRP